MCDRLLFGVQTPTQRPWPELAAQWRWLDDLGFDSLWLADHFVPPFRLDGPIFEAWTALAALAGCTTRARIGVLVSSNTFRHPPLVAKQAVTIDHLSGGRLEFGLGAGWFAPEHAMFGIPFPEPAELVERFREAVEVCDLLLTHDVASYDGRFYHLREARFRPAPVQRPRPPFTLGAHGPRMMRVVARHAQRWNSIGTLSQMAERNATLDAACAEIGRDPKEILRSHLYVPGILTEERPWDSPEALRDFVGRFRETGVTEFILQPPVGIAPEAVERLARETIPDLKRDAVAAG
ncbi:MAG: LLM class flavin-dependent oxidoreductase [Thermomicrobiales bacterium]|nr:LLM class flavin-dependent oxidoreductase [Thermomicrobiales bacterium]